ncbi:Rha family transcriptional regulator [Salmonella enterica]|uniref:Rha family transcriptional regulator n=1 Tax=Salmonella enterica TaxID=28901 RepID=UPI0009AF92B9|nr:Rha family transcriptional regulator [Salmonella enterica]EBR9219552.1 Rha family transcriptional regulator [Salmonella enterica subsp. enterica serovar Wangata]EBW2268831.1 Rha family transcriptional regulator [Salmonella enterica subsp. enterica serovar Hillingdon]EDU3845496.1 Rha family transcriptional regulator [Salmonella enterica subsp. enterica serovar Essen]ECA5261633.1 Rha family transcriptional regulator [Salmonella enterica subsp. enterica serovar Wangata]EDR0865886.1 Rha family 
MIESVSCVIPEITVHNNRPVTTSIAVANFFGKLHKDVLKKIRSLECSPAFTTANFCAVVVTARAGFDEREIEAFEMTKNGFIFLVMGFTGKKAAAFKEAYIAEFDRMEAELLQQKTQPPAPSFMPVFPVEANFEYLTTVRAGQIIDIRLGRQNEIFISLESYQELSMRGGYIAIHHDELRTMTSPEIVEICNKAAKMQEKWGRIYASS